MYIDILRAIIIFTNLVNGVSSGNIVFVIERLLYGTQSILKLDISPNTSEAAFVKMTKNA